MKQLSLFEVEQLKKGTYCCDNPECLARMFNKKFKVFTKTLDKRLIIEGREILIWLTQHKRERFTAKQVFVGTEGAHNKINDFQKLHWWKFIRKTKGDYWEFTQFGRRFYFGEVQVPKRIGILFNQVVWEDEAYVNIATVDDRWQEFRLDYTTDYVLPTQLNLI